jgi:hypothetical protein
LSWAFFFLGFGSRNGFGKVSDKNIKLTLDLRNLLVSHFG